MTMTEHHESALYVAAIAESRGESEAVKQMARRISQASEDELSLLERESAELTRSGAAANVLVEQGADPAANLAEARPFDPAFKAYVALLNRTEIGLARAELARGRDPELRELAARIVERVAAAP